MASWHLIVAKLAAQSSDSKTGMAIGGGLTGMGGVNSSLAGWHQVSTAVGSKLVSHLHRDAPLAANVGVTFTQRRTTCFAACREAGDGTIYVEGACHAPAADAESMMAAFLQGSANRSVGESHQHDGCFPAGQC